MLSFLVDDLLCKDQLFVVGILRVLCFCRLTSAVRPGDCYPVLFFSLLLEKFPIFFR